MNQLTQFTPQPPSLIYLANLGNYQARRTQEWALRLFVEEFSDGRIPHAQFPWARLDPIRISLAKQKFSAKYAILTVNRMMAALRGTLNAAFREGLLDLQTHMRLMAACKMLPGDRIHAGRMLCEPEIQRLFRAAAQGKSLALCVRDKAILAVLFGAGLRASEVRSLDITDYWNGMLQVRKSKGGKTRKLPLGKAAGRVQDWISIRREWPGPLFCRVGFMGDIQEVRLSQTGLRKLLDRISYRAGVDSWTPHDARRTYISMLLASGSDLGITAALAGHTRSSTTMLYDRRPLEARVEAVDRLGLSFE